ncbi:MAG: hypothetical protein K6U80_02360 [Firmicutes bacterium]|nr:hypothetical protein [Bacillota bacterium]
MTKLPLFPTLGRTLANAFKGLYSSLGFSMLMSLIWFLPVMPVLIVIFSVMLIPSSAKITPGEVFTLRAWAFLTVAVWNSFVTGPIVTTLYSLFQERKVDYPSIPMFFRLFKKFYWASVRITLAFSIAYLLLFLNIWIMLGTRNILLMVAGVISVYVLLAVWLMQFYTTPLIYLGNSFKKVLRKSFLLAMDNFALSFFYSLILGILFILSVFLPIFAIMFYGGILIFIMDQGFEVIYNKYD